MSITIIDGHNYLFRAFYGIPEAAQTKSGVQVNAVYGFFADLRKIANAYPSNKIFVVFDSETGIQDKVEENTEYKEGRTVNTDMFKQLPYIKQILDLMNIKWVEHQSFEADDIIASLATTWSNKYGKVYISSNDFDFIQIVSEKIVLLRAVQGKFVNCDREFVKNRFGVTPEQYADYLSMVGDKSDNIAGIKGLGPKTVSGALSKFNDIKGIFKSIASFPMSVQNKLLQGREQIEKNQKFITMRKDLPESEFIKGALPDINNAIIQQKIAIHLSNIGVR
jgi:DNA polymerase-1